MKIKYLFLPLLLVVLASCNREGCTHELADNYDKKAKVDNGTCSFAMGDYRYVLEDDIKITVGVATMGGPVGTATLEAKVNETSIAIFGFNGVYSEHDVDSQLFLNAAAKIGDPITLIATHGSQTGSGVATMNSNGELDYSFITVE